MKTFQDLLEKIENMINSIAVNAVEKSFPEIKEELTSLKKVMGSSLYPSDYYHLYNHAIAKIVMDNCNENEMDNAQNILTEIEKNKEIIKNEILSLIESYY